MAFAMRRANMLYTAFHADSELFSTASSISSMNCLQTKIKKPISLFAMPLTHICMPFF